MFFLSTEDDKVVAEAKHLNTIGDWKIKFTTEERSNEGFFSLVKHGDKRMLLDLLALHLAIHCDGFVGTLHSNWNRLIMELSSTVGYCAGCPYLEVDQPCSSVTECRLDFGE